MAMGILTLDNIILRDSHGTLKVVFRLDKAAFGDAAAAVHDELKPLRVVCGVLLLPFFPRHPQSLPSSGDRITLFLHLSGWKEAGKLPLSGAWMTTTVRDICLRDSSRMEWSAKASSQWVWEGGAPFHARAGDHLRQFQPTAWGIDHESLYSCGGGGCSGFDTGNGCSSKSCISASMDSDATPGVRAMIINFEAAPKDPSNKNELGRSEKELPVSVGSAESLIGLKLGKRTYFEDACTDSNGKNISFPAIPATSSATFTVKKARLSHQAKQISRCQVEGCNADLSSAKDYHRKHKVCEGHSKCPKVVVAGQERRFCQQCSRFHELSEFDQKKRSCRRRLSDHNARRRKPPAESTPFNSARFSSSFYDDRKQMNLLLNQPPFGHLRLTNSTWESSSDFKLPQVKGPWIRSTKAGDICGQLIFPSNELSMTIPTLRHDLDRLLPFKGTTAEVLNQGLEASATASNLDGAPDIRRALSLLSTGSWASADPGPTSPVSQHVHVNHTSPAQSMVHVARMSSEYWQSEQSLDQEPRVFPFNLHSNGSQFQEFQLLKAPYENSFFDTNHLD
ncbi:hypothetical protein Taro_049825 [Colocasia esculenta]|uniref:SBP-type domain-containing protein n=1 Tax=Colocasia esculenta TaxID=4460 RepID=A0A843XBT4_COLES|nr:hypothetical protein [Colocasia esculenta]